ncbi:MAG: hypothetical protein V2G41_09840 [bacterium JZ-2024 1]
MKLYHVALQKTSYVPAGVLFSHLALLSRRHGEWVYCSHHAIEAKTGLSYYKQKKARECLIEAGLLEERRDGWTRRMWYRVPEEYRRGTSKNQAQRLNDLNTQCSSDSNTLNRLKVLNRLRIKLIKSIDAIEKEKTRERPRNSEAAPSSERPQDTLEEAIASIASETMEALGAAHSDLRPKDWEFLRHVLQPLRGVSLSPSQMDALREDVRNAITEAWHISDDGITCLRGAKRQIARAVQRLASAAATRPPAQAATGRYNLPPALPPARNSADGRNDSPLVRGPSNNNPPKPFTPSKEFWALLREGRWGEAKKIIEKTEASNDSRC